MNRVAFSAEEVPLPPWKKEAERFTLRVLSRLKRKNWDLSVLFCGNGTIKRLNAEYRNRNEPTDVLSFILGETVPDPKGGSRYLPGDIVVSLDALAENARYFGVSPDEELRRLLIHGILHLDGLDHRTNKPGEPMLQLQEKILKELAQERIIPAHLTGAEG
ncbi:MAG: rRNA maturation RNase YbeY [Treponema sp.]|jgi:probable rRNA maturation factor|nr:rRNA maturation RNase YbeY [Treponema sp.]